MRVSIHIPPPPRPVVSAEQAREHALARLRVAAAWAAGALLVLWLVGAVPFLPAAAAGAVWLFVRRWHQSLLAPTEPTVQTTYASQRLTSAFYEPGGHQGGGDDWGDDWGDDAGE